MASALQEALSKPSRRPKPHKYPTTQGITHMGNQYPFQPTTKDYAKVARHYELLNNNNSAFNGRNLSDN